MKEKFFDLEILTPFQIIYHEKVRHIRVPGVDGYFGVLAGHAPLITSLTIGEIKVDLENGRKYFATSGGTIEVLPYKTSVLVETAESVENIDIARAAAAKARAEKRMKEKQPETNLERAKLALMKANNRLKIQEKH